MQTAHITYLDALKLLASDPSLAPAFRAAFQLPFQPADFRQLIRRDDEPTAVGYGISDSLEAYRG